MKLRACLLGSLLVASACGFNRSGVSLRGTVDGPGTVTTLDRGGEAAISDRPGETLRDSRGDRRLAEGQVLDKPVLDHPIPDHPIPDKPIPDKPIPDKPIPDKLAPDTSPDCLGKYGSVGIPKFKLCPSTGATCAFYFGPGTCDDMCAKGGGTCVKSLVDSDDGCTTYAEESCSYSHGDAVCVCSL